MWLRSYAARQTTQGVKPYFLLNALQLTTTNYGAAASHGGQIEIPALTAANAQDAGGSYFEHILLCTTSVAFGHWASLVSVSGTYGA